MSSVDLDETRMALASVLTPGLASPYTTNTPISLTWKQLRDDAELIRNAAFCEAADGDTRCLIDFAGDDCLIHGVSFHPSERLNMLLQNELERRHLNHNWINLSQIKNYHVVQPRMSRSNWLIGIDQAEQRVLIQVQMVADLAVTDADLAVINISPRRLKDIENRSLQELFGIEV